MNILIGLLFVVLFIVLVREFFQAYKDKPLKPIERFNKMFGKTFKGMKVKYNFIERTNTLVILDRGLFKFDPDSKSQNACFNIVLHRIKKANINVQEIIS